LISRRKWDIFAGIVTCRPRNRANALEGGDSETALQLRAYQRDAILSIAHYLNRQLGWEIIGDVHLQDESWGRKKGYRPREPIQRRVGRRDLPLQTFRLQLRSLIFWWVAR